ncbi:MAG TPA: c-type cytochrome [Bryobacteraceae bacterium]|nr:c-type cytochrome [Bryobacteraceae bacterium]
MRRLAKAIGCLALAVAAWAAGGSLLRQAPAKFAERKNPFAGDEQARLAGAKLYAHECAACHGSNGEGIGKAPPLKRTDVIEAPPGALFWVLRNGSLYRGMPSFAHLPQPQRWEIITFLQETKNAAHPGGTDRVE